jgi:1-acyl-sn-glycerol-3-phosphate acyltransferase
VTRGSDASRPPSALAVDDPWLSRWRRRALSVSIVLVALVCLIGLAPLLLVLLALVDLAGRRSFALVRFYAMSAAVAVLEVAGLGAALTLFVRFGPRVAGEARAEAAHLRAQAAWVGAMTWAAGAIFGFRLEPDGAIPPLAPDARTIVLVRHATVVDALFPTVLFGERGRRLLRFVLKRELLWDPCLDVFGQRLPNAFVAREGADGERERLRVRALAEGLRVGEGLVLFPEGTRFSAERRARAIERLETRGRGEAAARARALVATLPPRLGGFEAALDALAALGGAGEVLVLGHAGLEGVRRLSDVWRGNAIGARVVLRAWSHAASDVPATREGRELWLHARWLELDRWVDAQLARRV